ncbi:hypothetical protein LCGC14_0809160 [marine sediment metagenome]|uniref:Uncharacterized protein n=1 Tax=marine sediment metagenome TaxID=412755 RepID=A0A0F9PM86_9ZZZZ
MKILRKKTKLNVYLRILEDEQQILRLLVFHHFLQLFLNKIK